MRTPSAEKAKSATMDTTNEIDIYWANSIFSAADRTFNDANVQKLRSLGYSVYSPQEASINSSEAGSSPSARSVFLVDTEMLKRCRILVACIDQESIDSGVACEVGFAVAIGLPVIGYYTDIRQFRVGDGRMYKNLYVIGSIEMAGGIVHNEAELLTAVRAVLDPTRATQAIQAQSLAARHFDVVASSYDEYVEKLESFYVPAWTAEETVLALVEQVEHSKALEFGSGTGRLAEAICQSFEVTRYVGVDEALEMIQVARSRSLPSQATFHTSFDSLAHDEHSPEFDLGISAFALHDVVAPNDALATMATLIKPGGHILIMDLAVGDLPALTRILLSASGLAMIPGDNRLSGPRLMSFLSGIGLELMKFEFSLPEVVFPSPMDVDEYFSAFGIYNGFDIPGLRPGDEPSDLRRRVLDILENLAFPLSDIRVFAVAIMRKLG